MLNDICKRLESIRSDVKLGKHGGKDNIGVRVGKVINKYKVAKHFVLQIRDDGFDFHIDEHKVASEATLDGIYVIRTSVPEQRLSPDDTVRCYKSLSQVERAFRSIKTIDLKRRRACVRFATASRHGYAPTSSCACSPTTSSGTCVKHGVHCSSATRTKKPRKRGTRLLPLSAPRLPCERYAPRNSTTAPRPRSSFQTLLKALSTIVRNICRAPGDNPDAPTFQVVTTPDPKQQRAYDLPETIIL